MELKHYGYLMFLIAMFAEEGMFAEEVTIGAPAATAPMTSSNPSAPEEDPLNTTAEDWNIALNRPVVVGGGVFQMAVDGDRRMERNKSIVNVKAGYNPVWVRVELDPPNCPYEVCIIAEIQNPFLGYAEVSFLGVKYRNEMPDISEHVACHKKRTQTLKESYSPCHDCTHLDDYLDYWAVALFTNQNVGLNMVEMRILNTRGINMALKMPVTVGGGEYANIVDGDKNTFSLTRHSDRLPTWYRVELERPEEIFKIRLKGEIKPFAEITTSYILLVEERYDIPDPGIHHACFNFNNAKIVKQFPEEVNCSTAFPKAHSVSVWGSPFIELKIYELRIQGQACIFAVSTSVLLGCQVLVLLIQRFAQ